MNVNVERIAERITFVNTSEPIILQLYLKGFSVPYWRPEDDPQSHSYIELKERLEDIALIPEVKDWPELENAIERINATTLRTVGCAAWVSAQGGSIKLVSYIGFAYDRMDLNQNIVAYYSLFHQRATSLYRKALPREFQTIFEIKSTGFNGRKLGLGWSAEFWAQGFGNSIEEARTIPNLAYSLLTDFLVNELPQV